MDAQLKRGMTEACVLALLLAGDSYGYQISRQAAAVIELSESTLYPVLRRLEASGALTVLSSEHNGRLRKYYHITPQGRRQLDTFLEDWEAMLEVCAFIRNAKQKADQP